MREQQQINYSDVMSLGFNEELCYDNIYFNQYGFQYAIITMNLTNEIYIQWEKETRFCEIVRMDNPKQCNILARCPIIDLEELKRIINFFN